MSNPSIMDNFQYRNGWWEIQQLWNFSRAPPKVGRGIPTDSSEDLRRLANRNRGHFRPKRRSTFGIDESMKTRWKFFDFPEDSVHISFSCVFSPRADWIPWLKRGFLWMHLPNFAIWLWVHFAIRGFDHFDPSPCFFQVGYHMLQLWLGRNPKNHLGWFKPYK